MHRFLASFLLSAALLPASLLQVTINTTSLIGNTNGPYILDFQLTDGSGTNANLTALRLTNFNFTGGSAGSPSTTGAVSGSLAAGFLLSTSQFFNELQIPFTPGDSLQFVMQNTIFGYATPFPDGFTFAILDKTSSEIPTTHPLNIFSGWDFVDSSSSPLAYGAADNSIAAPLIADYTPTAPSGNVPEPGSWQLLLAGLLGCAGLWFRDQRLRALHPWRGEPTGHFLLPGHPVRQDDSKSPLHHERPPDPD